MASDERDDSFYTDRGFHRAPVRGSTYDRGGYADEPASGRNYPGNRGRRSYTRGPYVPGGTFSRDAFYDRGADPYGGNSPESGGDTFRDRGGARRSGGPYAGRGPRGYRRSDERIRADVNDALTEDGWIDATEITVTVERGEVTIEGTVESRAMKRLAEDVAEGVPGVRDVHNRLTITRGER